MNIKYMEEAIKLAEENANNGFKEGGPFGAVIVDSSGNVVGRGRNKVLKNNDATAHAEVQAIRDAGKNLNTHDLKGCTIYTSCYPCPMCLAAIMWANIENIYYANTKEDAEKIGFRDSKFYEMLKSDNMEGLNLTQIKTKDAIETFKKYEDDNDKTIY